MRLPKNTIDFHPFQIVRFEVEYLVLNRRKRFRATTLQHCSELLANAPKVVWELSGFRCGAVMIALAKGTNRFQTWIRDKQKQNTRRKYTMMLYLLPVHRVGLKCTSLLSLREENRLLSDVPYVFWINRLP